MKTISTHIGSLLGILILVASLLPSIHAFSHEVSLGGNNFEYSLAADTIDCDLCDFNFSTLDSPPNVDYSIYAQLKETAYFISLAQTVFLYPDNLFSLRAPPIVIA